MSVRLAPVHIGRVLHNAIAFTPHLYRSDIGSLLQGYAPDIDGILKELAPHLSA